MADGETRISVSEEKLNLALAQMELRLRIYFDEQLKSKQDTGPFALLALTVDKLDRGDFTPVHERALTDFIESVLDEKTDRGWNTRERLFMTIGVIATVISLALSIYVTTSVATASPPPEGGVSSVR